MRQPADSGNTHGAGRPTWLVLAVLMLAGVSRVHAHYAEDDSLPGTAGWRIGAAAAVSGIRASGPWPTPRWTGVLGSGQTPSDLRGVQLEHGVLDAAARVDLPGDIQAAGLLAVGWHGSEAAHVESALLAVRRRFGDDRLELAAGRMSMPMGAALTQAGHLDRYAQTPLIKRAVMDGDWVDDGASLNWLRNDGQSDGVQLAQIGLWRAGTLPGSAKGSAAPGLHVRAGWGEWQADGFAVWMAPLGRGAYANGTTAGHTHSQPDCSSSLSGITCFGGRTTVAGASLRWRPHDTPIQLEWAGLLQRDRGTLESVSGQADYSGRTNGGWMDAVWLIDERWQLGLRAERLVALHNLVGPGATGVARDAGLADNQPASRLAASLTWDPRPGWRVAGEAGTERGGVASLRWVGVRLIWRQPDLLGGRTSAF